MVWQRNCQERHGKCKRLRLDLHTVTKATSWNSGPIPCSTERLLNTARHRAFQTDLERKVTDEGEKIQTETFHNALCLPYKTPEAPTTALICGMEL